MHRLIRGTLGMAVVPAFCITLMASSAVAATISTFDTNSGGWISVGFQNASNFPLFTSMLTSSAVTYNSTGGNPGGYISTQDPDGNWQYFSAPGAFLGDQSSQIGQSLTFNELILNTFGQPALNPQGPLVAITNGSLTLVFGGGGSVPPVSGTSWNSLSVPLIATSWDVGQPGGAVATSAQFSSVMSGLTGVYILSDFWTGSGSSGEILGLDNVALGTQASTPEPGTMSFLMVGLAGLGLWRRSRRN